jgi:hypothetical protein
MSYDSLAIPDAVGQPSFKVRVFQYAAFIRHAVDIAVLSQQALQYRRSAVPASNQEYRRRRYAVSTEPLLEIFP